MAGHGPIDPAVLARIGDLELAARTVVDGLEGGRHRGARTGAATEFAQYRAYVQGDDTRRIDWNLYGRSDRLHIRQSEQESRLRCTLILDCSASMGYGSGALDKLAYARLLAASLAVLLKRQGDAVGLAAYAAGLTVFVPPGAGPEHLRRVLVELDRLRAAGATDAEGVLDWLGPRLRPRGLAVLISDLLYPPSTVVHRLQALRARRHDVLALQLSDAAERDFPFEGPLVLQDAEGGGERFVEAERARSQYLEARRQHFDGIRRACLDAEIDTAEFVTDQPLDGALRHFLRRRHRVLNAARRQGRR